MGDQLTCKNIRGAKLWRCPELNVIDQLKWANELPGMSMYIYMTMYEYAAQCLLLTVLSVQEIFTSFGSVRKSFSSHSGEAPGLQAPSPI